MLCSASAVFCYAVLCCALPCHAVRTVRDAGVIRSFQTQDSTTRLQIKISQYLRMYFDVQVEKLGKR